MKMGMQLALEQGNLSVTVNGSNYDKPQKLIKELKKEYGDNFIRFTTTPVCDYQIESRWPEPPFININLKDAPETTKDNWVGYISGVALNEDDAKISLVDIFNQNGTFDVYGKIEKGFSHYEVVLYISEEYGNAMCYITHTKEELEYLDELVTKLDEACDKNLQYKPQYLPVKIKKKPESAQYDFYYDKKLIGKASYNSINKRISDKEMYSDGFMQISHIRYGDIKTLKPFSRVYIKRKVILKPVDGVASKKKRSLFGFFNPK